MSGKLIFKMELFKYMKDRNYLIVTGILAIINICSTVYLIHLLDHINNLSESASNMLGLFFIFFSISVFANIAFMFLYPFHLMSLDYKNDVMAMLVASGVNRTRLFFSKIGATFLWSLGVTFVLVFIPGFIVLFKVSQTTGVMAVISQFFEVLNVNKVTLLGFSFNVFNTYINTLVLISAATILMKGRNLTILVYFGFTMIQSMIINALSLIPSSLNFSDLGYAMFENLLLILSSVVVVLMSLRIMKSQNL